MDSRQSWESGLDDDFASTEDTTIPVAGPDDAFLTNAMNDSYSGVPTNFNSVSCQHLPHYQVPVSAPTDTSVIESTTTSVPQLRLQMHNEDKDGSNDTFTLNNQPKTGWIYFSWEMLPDPPGEWELVINPTAEDKQSGFLRIALHIVDRSGSQLGRPCTIPLKRVKQTNKYKFSYTFSEYPYIYACVYYNGLCLVKTPHKQAFPHKKAQTPAKKGSGSQSPLQKKK